MYPKARLLFFCSVNWSNWRLTLHFETNLVPILSNPRCGMRFRASSADFLHSLRIHVICTSSSGAQKKSCSAWWKNPLPEGLKEELLLQFTGALPPPDGQRGGDRDTPGALPLSPGRIFQPSLGSALPSIGWCCPHSIIPLQTLYIKNSQLLLLPESLGGVCCVVLTLLLTHSLISFLLSIAWGAALQESLGYAKPAKWNNFWCPVSQKNGVLDGIKAFASTCWLWRFCFC